MFWFHCQTFTKLPHAHFWRNWILCAISPQWLHRIWYTLTTPMYVTCNLILLKSVLLIRNYGCERKVFMELPPFTKREGLTLSEIPYNSFRIHHEVRNFAYKSGFLELSKSVGCWILTTCLKICLISFKSDLPISLPSWLLWGEDKSRY